MIQFEDHIFQMGSNTNQWCLGFRVHILRKKIEGLVDSAWFADIPKIAQSKAGCLMSLTMGRSVAHVRQEKAFLTAKGSGLYIDEGQTKDHEIKDNELSRLSMI